MKHGALVAGTASGAAFASLVPVAAFLVLTPAQYGTFSLPYLIYAFGISLQFSIVSDAWTRTAKRSGMVSPWGDYFAAVLLLAASVGLVSVVVLLVTPATHSVAWSAGVIALAVIRNGSRYHAVAARFRARAIAADLAGIAGFAVALLTGISRLDPLEAVLIAWAAASIVGMAGLEMPQVKSAAAVPRWFRDHGVSIRPLLADSLLLDLGSIGTPFLLAPFLGLHRFGIYRGISNVALPVRLVLDPIRPALAGSRAQSVTGRRPLFIVLASAVLLALVCFAVLAWVVPALGFAVGTLSSLSQFALPCAVYVLASFASQFYYMVCRMFLAPPRLLIGRIVQTIAAVLMPIIGLIERGLAGAIWGFVAGTVLTAVIWIGLAMSMHGSEQRSDGVAPWGVEREI